MKGSVRVENSDRPPVPQNDPARVRKEAETFPQPTCATPWMCVAVADDKRSVYEPIEATEFPLVTGKEQTIQPE